MTSRELKRLSNTRVASVKMPGQKWEFFTDTDRMSLIDAVNVLKQKVEELAKKQDQITLEREKI